MRVAETPHNPEKIIFHSEKQGYLIIDDETNLYYRSGGYWVRDIKQATLYSDDVSSVIITDLNSKGRKISRRWQNV